MNRTNLDFLSPIFANNDIDDFNLTIINQSENDSLLFSKTDNIKVINSKSTGLPVSRNMALKYAVAEICLIADDDIIYLSNLKEKILKAYREELSADIITFEAMDSNKQPFSNYPLGKIHNKKSLRKISSIVTTFRRSSILKHKVFFNHYFGLGSVFKGASEYIFLRNALKKKLMLLHSQTNIVIHPGMSSGKNMGSNDAFFSKSAMMYRYHGILSYPWLLKYSIFMWKDGYIEFNQLLSKFIIGLKGIKRYKQLKRQNEIEKVYTD